MYLFNNLRPSPHCHPIFLRSLSLCLSFLKYSETVLSGVLESCLCETPSCFGGKNLRDHKTRGGPKNSPKTVESWQAAYRRRPLQNAGKKRELLGKLHEKPFDFISFVLVTPISTRSSVLGGNFCDPSNEARTCRRSLREILILKGFFAKNRVFCLFFWKGSLLIPPVVRVGMDCF